MFLTTCTYTDARDDFNRTPLHRACLGGYTDVVRFLVEEGKCNIGKLIIM